MKLKQMLVPWKKSYNKPRQRIKKQRHYFANKGPDRRTDAFKLWSWRRLLRVPWTARRSNQTILEEINPEYSLEGLMLKLKFQYSGHLMQSQHIRKDPETGKDWGQEEKGDDRGWDGWMASPIQWTWVWANSRRWWRTGKPGMLQSLGLQSQTRLSDWTAAMCELLINSRYFWTFSLQRFSTANK